MKYLLFYLLRYKTNLFLIRIFFICLENSILIFGSLGENLTSPLQRDGSIMFFYKLSQENVSD